MIKEILWDADGVTIAKREGYFSEKLAKRQGLPLEKVLPFFKSEFGLCITGKADLKQEVARYLPEWGWSGSIDELLNYWFSGENTVDTEVLKVVDDLRSKSVKCYLATDQEKYRAEYILEQMRLGDHFDGHFFSCDIGFKKSQPEFFQEVIKILGVKPVEIMYWDDDEKNVTIARDSGIDARLFKDVADLTILGGLHG